MTRAYQKPGRTPCEILGCQRPLYCRGMCVMHYSRFRAGVPIGGNESHRAPNGTGYLNVYGYIIIGKQSHPLANVQGKVLEHRAVLFDSIGHGAHPCHWCGKSLTWKGGAAVRINVDHLNFDRVDNALANLVPSCLDCNTKRTQFARQPRPPRPKYVLNERQKADARKRAATRYALIKAERQSA